MKRYFSIDCEFSGLNHRKNCLLSVGIIEIENKNGKYYPIYDRKFYIELKPDGEINKESMKINGLNIDNLMKYGVSKNNFIREVNKYLDLNKNDTAIFIGYCVVLDKIFIDQIYQDLELENPFNYEVIDISSLAIGKLNLEWGYSEEELLNILGLENTDSKHHALYDAILQAQEFCEIMNFNK